jgi:hypothetical protein
MGYPDPRWLLRSHTLEYHIQEEHLPFLSLQSEYALLQQLLQLPEEALYHLTLHRFASILQPFSPSINLGMRA